MTGADFSGVDIDLLADYVGGALEGTPDESVVATLIADDPAWRAAYESLNGGVALVRAELGRMGPEPMPADLSARLDGLFRGPQLTLVAGDAPSGRPAQARGRRRRWTTPIAIAAGFIFFVGFGADYLSGRGGSDDTAASTAADSSAGGAEGAAALPGGRQILTTGTDYTRATLAAPPMQPMDAPDSSKASGFGESETDGGQLRASAQPRLARLTDPAALQECLDAIERENGDGTVTVESADYARFDGVPALIVRFTAGNGSWAWAAGADCGTRVAGADAIDKVPVR